MKQPKQIVIPQSVTKWLLRSMAFAMIILPVSLVAYLGISQERSGHAGPVFHMSIGAVTATSVAVNWTEYTNAKVYYVQRNVPQPTVSTTLSGGVYSHNWTGLSCGTQYGFSVTAQDSQGTQLAYENYQGPVYATTSACPYPSPPAPYVTPYTTPYPTPTQTPPASSTQPVTPRPNTTTQTVTQAPATPAPTPLQGATNDTTDSTTPLTAKDLNVASPSSKSTPARTLTQKPAKRTSIWAVILKVLLILGLIIAVIFGVLYALWRYRTKKQIEAIYEDYHHKMTGV